MECDGIDILAGHGERTARTAAALGIPLDSQVVRCAARAEQERGQRFEFRLRTREGVFATGRVDGGAVYAVYRGETDFLASVRDRFVAFLASLRVGAVLTEGCGPDAESSAVDGRYGLRFLSRTEQESYSGQGGVSAFLAQRHPSPPAIELRRSRRMRPARDRGAMAGVH